MAHPQQPLPGVTPGSPRSIEVQQIRDTIQAEYPGKSDAAIDAALDAALVEYSPGANREGRSGKNWMNELPE